MKYFFGGLALVFIVFACNKRIDDGSGYNIKGTAAGFDSIFIFLQKVEDNNRLVTIDSVLCLDGRFHFTGKVDFASLHYLSFGKKQFHFDFFLENAPAEIYIHHDSLKNIRINGLKSNDKYRQYKEEVLPFDNKMKDLQKQFIDAKKENNKSLMEQISETNAILLEDKQTFVKNYIATHNQSAITPYVLLRDLSYALDAPQLDSMVGLLDDSLSLSLYTVKLKKRLVLLNSIKPGAQAPDFVLPDTLGNEVVLSSFKGSYLLIYFWASWNRQCRILNNDYKKFYDVYKSNGFEILGVSLDKSHTNWMEAISEDEVLWPQTGDMKAFDSEVVKMFVVDEIPTNLLLDKEGRVLGRNLSIEELRKMIDKL